MSKNLLVRYQSLQFMVSSSNLAEFATQVTAVKLMIPFLVRHRQEWQLQSSVTDHPRVLYMWRGNDCVTAGDHELLSTAILSGNVQEVLLLSLALNFNEITTNTGNDKNKNRWCWMNDLTALKGDSNETLRSLECLWKEAVHLICSIVYCPPLEPHGRQTTEVPVIFQ